MPRAIASYSSSAPFLKSPIGIIANGEFETNNQALIQKVKDCWQIIAADGGLNHCFNAGILPDVVIGDLDSVDPVLLKKFPKAHIIRLDSRAKDKTDLEEALLYAKISEVARVIIFGGLGNRVDHSLANIFLLLRYPGRLFLQTSKEKIFALNADVKNFELECSPNQILKLIPVYGTVENVHIQCEDAKYHSPLLDKDKEIFSAKLSGKKFKASVSHGEVLCILSDEEQKIEDLKKIGPTFCSFKLESQTFAEALKLIRHVSQYPYYSCIETDSELLFVLNPFQGKWSVPYPYKSQILRGITISLLPFNGPAEATLNGLKWQGRISFSKDFLGISNVALTPTFSVQVSKGNLLCIVNKKHIDHEMLKLKDKTSTAIYDSQ